MTKNANKISDGPLISHIEEEIFTDTKIYKLNITLEITCYNC
jgi:hypothetical protein